MQLFQKRWPVFLEKIPKLLEAQLKEQSAVAILCIYKCVDGVQNFKLFQLTTSVVDGSARDAGDIFKSFASMLLKMYVAASTNRL